jgi:hypothetical protein
LAKRKRYHVYVIELSRKIWTESKKFRDENPQYNGVLECLYVGMTSQSPKERFKKHKTGYRTAKGNKTSSSFVEKYGRYLRPSLYEHLNPLSKADAIKMEEELAETLKKKRYAVWWN